MIVFTIIKVMVLICVIYLVSKNISLFKDTDEKYLKTNGSVGKMTGSGDEIASKLEEYGKYLLSKNDKICNSAKKQILDRIKFKQEPNQEPNQEESDPTRELDWENKKSAPVLENFEDYAPVDINDSVPVQQDKNILFLSKNNKHTTPSASAVDGNQETHQISGFGPEYRVPWSGKMGKDDLSYFFTTHKFDSSQSDPPTKKPVMSPNDWEVGTPTHPNTPSSRAPEPYAC